MIEGEAAVKEEAPGITEVAKIALDSPTLASGEATEVNVEPDDKFESANEDAHGNGRPTKTLALDFLESDESTLVVEHE